MPTPATELANDVIDSQGATLQFCSSGIGTVDTFLPHIIGSIPQINSGKAYDDVTAVDDDKRKYGEQTLPEDQDFELVFADVPANSDQKTFTDLVEAGTEITIKITRKTGRVQEAVFVPHDHFSGESGKDVGKQMYGCIGKLQTVAFSTVPVV
ncbi:hypothetical protein [Catenovulum sediminis]|uniref:Phage tail protein n=1 Tax=Catenovulum sediminis TaxID=1740262 RepID=A0ABV1RK96_9ALTE|nr:hypothetical protein [Catenovulum sediminis]